MSNTLGGGGLRDDPHEQNSTCENIVNVSICKPPRSLLLLWQSSPTRIVRGEAANPMVSRPGMMHNSQIPKVLAASSLVTPPCHQLPELMAIAPRVWETLRKLVQILEGRAAAHGLKPLRCRAPLGLPLRTRVKWWCTFQKPCLVADGALFWRNLCSLATTPMQHFVRSTQKILSR